MGLLHHLRVGEKLIFFFTDVYCVKYTQAVSVGMGEGGKVVWYDD